MGWMIVHYDKAVRLEAARKAVHTIRMNCLKKSNMAEVMKLAAEIIKTEFEVDDDFTLDGIIAREIGKTTWQSFCRFGDKRSASNGLILSWIERKALPLDEQAIFISANNNDIEINPEALAAFIQAHQRGRGDFAPYYDLEQLKRTFRHVAGFHWHLKFARAHILNSNNTAIRKNEEDYF